MVLSEHAAPEPFFEYPGLLRAEIRAKRFTKTTSGQAPGFTQVNLVVLPKDLAFEFAVFCQRNPKPCPLLEVLDASDPVSRLLASRPTETMRARA